MKYITEFSETFFHGYYFGAIEMPFFIIIIFNFPLEPLFFLDEFSCLLVGGIIVIAPPWEEAIGSY